MSTREIPARSRIRRLRRGVLSSTCVLALVLVPSFFVLANTTSSSAVLATDGSRLTQAKPTRQLSIGRSLSISQVWTQTLNDAGSPIAQSSPNVANLNGSPAVVVGDRAGYVYAFNLATGIAVPGWPYNAGAPVDSTPSVAPVNGGALDSVFVGTGNAANPTSGGYQAISPGGGDQWFVQETNPTTNNTAHNGVQASMAVGNLQGGTDVVAPSLGQEEYAMNASSGSVLNGFPWYQADSGFTTPALADLYNNGQTEIVEGGDSTAGTSYGTTYSNGGHLRILSSNGNAGQPEPNGGLICQYNTDQVVQSSPAVGEFLGTSSTVGIVFGTGSFYSGASTTNHLLAVDSHCNLLWNVALDGATNSSPALADVLGNGELQVIEGTNTNNSSGSVWALNGANGQAIWHVPVSGAVIGSVVTADLTRSGYQDVIVPTTNGVQILDGKTGSLITTLGQYEAFQNSPLVTEDPNGTIGITIAGYNSSDQGVITHYEVAGSNGGLVNENGAWPMFHHDPQLTGDAGTPPPNIRVPCDPPSTNPYGYYMVGTDGGVFNFGNLPFCGSTGAITLNQPVVGIAVTRDAGGYWLVARDGGIFNFGNAQIFGSLPGVGVHVTNIVGMVPTLNGQGYWLVGSDGGTFAFGDAGFVGSLPGIGVHVNNIVGIVPTSTGNGYWMVGSDGGVFAFGDAGFVGSLPGIGVHVDNIVGVAGAP